MTYEQIKIGVCATNTIAIFENFMSGDEDLLKMTFHMTEYYGLEELEEYIEEKKKNGQYGYIETRKEKEVTYTEVYISKY